MARNNPFKKLDAKWAAAFNRGDAAGVVALHTRNTVLVAPGGGLVKGRKARQAIVQGGIDGGARDLKFTTVEAGADGDLGYELGRYSMEVATATGKRREKGYFLAVLKRRKDGSWQSHAIAHNSDTPQK
jgi:uncharacterized protein (TIGR02246 family)